MATIKITYYGMDGEGPTVRAAKEDAGRKVETALREAKHGVHLIAFAGLAAVVAYDVSQGEWGYRLINTEPGKFHAGPQWVTCCGDRQASRLAALRHIVDIAWSPSVEDDDAFADDALAGRDHGCPITHTERATMKRDLMERWAWQRRYRAAREAGNSDDDARYIASGLHHLVKTADGKVTVCSIGLGGTDAQ